ncbi:Ribosomal protein L18ae family [Abeliophyllum distichum]|uniref:Ribosomal protein L18ae family n=1 Tax=Abeliophyllum distichum TaxID=126358 RepID=A0ABD1QGM9_9LAMI
MTEEGGGKSIGVATASGEQPSPNYYYGTFQGVANYQPQPTASPPPPSQHVIGFPQPMPPAGPAGSQPHYYPHGYQTVPGYAVAEGRPFREYRLPCCGLGIGWFLFIIGFILGAIPWYIGAFILLCVRMDYREKPGLIACTLAATLAVIAVTLGVTRATHAW